jgi:hypothetical protein
VEGGGVSKKSIADYQAWRAICQPPTDLENDLGTSIEIVQMTKFVDKPLDPRAELYGLRMEDARKVSFEVKDSGAREQFDSGMVRDTQEGKPLFDLVFDGPMLARWAVHLTKGAIKYAVRNWMKATGQKEADRFRASAARHFFQWMNGETDEDHAAAVFFNINGYEYVKGKLNVGKPSLQSEARDQDQQ